jgi:hypothetical protein
VIDILSYLPGRKKKNSSGWVSFNAPCCVHNGETQDRRHRGGIKTTDQGWSFHCFNCGFTASFILGRTLSFKARRLLQWMMVPQEEIERVNLESLKHRSIQGILDDRQKTSHSLQGIEFEDRDLPEEFALIDRNMPVHWQYLRDRCVPEDYPIGMIHGQPDDKFSRRQGVIIPFTYNGRIVGHTRRFFDDHNPRYIHDMQPGFVFGTDLQQPNWQHAIVVEGVFDALSISGLAVLHAEINDQQARLIRSLDREITVVPDQDEAGMRLVNRAIELEWAVSMPEWPQDVKDVNDAVKKYGKLATLIHIFQSREVSRLKIELLKKRLLTQITKK